MNRVWQWHFGNGLVASPNDFGELGQMPSHPELLDWLALNFGNEGGSFKKLHKLLVMSATYRQSSDGNEKFAKADSGNRLLWRMNRRKLSAEEIRDAILSVSGKLNLEMGGPGYYLFALDCADSSQSTPKRNETLTALQALSLLNNKFRISMARHFASRLEKEADDMAEQVKRGHFLVTGRAPVKEEADLLLQYTRKHGLQNLCRALFNLSEFTYLDLDESSGITLRFSQAIKLRRIGLSIDVGRRPAVCRRKTRTASSPQGQASHPALHGGCCQPSRHVRFQA